MSYQSHKKKIEKTGHYYTLGQPGQHIKRLWMVCHGYGQLASHFIQKFDGLDTGEDFILAPEGLHRFYWNGFSKKVVASWMTKEDRLDEIADYSHWLQSLYDWYVPKMGSELEIILLGFSQGCATQFRWIYRNQPQFHKLVLWAGLPPEDLDYKVIDGYLEHKEFHLIYGTEDQFLKVEQIQEFIKTVETDNLKFEHHVSPGMKHVVERKMLLSFFKDRIQ